MVFFDARASGGCGNYFANQKPTHGSVGSAVTATAFEISRVQNAFPFSRV